MNLLHLTFGMGIGGTEQVIRQLVTALPKTQITARILCIDGHIGPMGAALQEEGIAVDAFPRQPGLDWALIRQIRAYIQRHNIEVVHAHQYTPYTYGWFAIRGLGVRLVFTEHGRFHPDRFRGKAALLNVFMALTTHAITAISSATRDALHRYEWMPKARVQVVYNGIKPLSTSIPIAPEQQLPNEGKTRWIGTVSRLDTVKNHPMLLRAMQQVLRRFPDTRLVIVGDGPERAALEDLATELGIAQQTLFTGFSAHAGEFMRQMDIFLLPSYTEGTSMTLLEAMSLGKPIVATAVGGTPEIVEHGKTGYLVPSDDAAALAAAIEQLLADPEQARRLGQAGAERFTERFHVAAMAATYARLYGLAEPVFDEVRNHGL